MTKEDLEERCLHQVFKQDLKIYVPIEGWGNCEKCTKDEYNKLCKGYTPIHLSYYKVKK